MGNVAKESPHHRPVHQRRHVLRSTANYLVEPDDGRSAAVLDGQESGLEEGTPDNRRGVLDGLSVVGELEEADAAADH